MTDREEARTMANSNVPVLSLVLPAFNEAGNVSALATRLKEVVGRIGMAYEIVWVNDGSSDNTAEVLEKLAKEDNRIVPIHFSRNFGHMAALTAGIDAARASGAVITLDSDGQHPPELIEEMVHLWKQGAEIVQTVRADAAQTGLVKRLSSKLFYRCLNVMADIEIPEGAADFRLLDRQVVEVLKSLPERARFLRGLVYWVGFEKAVLPYTAERRLSGETKYSFVKMVALALSGITSFSYRPLRIALVLGFVVSLLAVLDAVYVFWAYFREIELVPGWASTLLAILTLGAVQLITLGIASEYLARLYYEQKSRPIYIIRKRTPVIKPKEDP